MVESIESLHLIPVVVITVAWVESFLCSSVVYTRLLKWFSFKFTIIALC